MRPRLSIVIPVKDDAASLERLLRQLSAELKAHDSPAEILVVDGGSRDRSVETAQRFGARVLRAGGGRGGQLNLGCRTAQAPLIWMLHADSEPSANAFHWLLSQQAIGWGRFDVCFNDSNRLMNLTAAMMNRRSRLTGICTGDQGIFLHRRLLEVIGGVPELPLMEDIELSRRLRRCCQPNCPAVTVQTSARRWQRDGWLKTVWSMWVFRLRYWLGEPAEQLARAYYPEGGATDHV